MICEHGHGIACIPCGEEVVRLRADLAAAERRRYACHICGKHVTREKCVVEPDDCRCEAELAAVTAERNAEKQRADAAEAALAFSQARESVATTHALADARRTLAEWRGLLDGCRAFLPPHFGSCAANFAGSGACDCGRRASAELLARIDDALRAAPATTRTSPEKMREFCAWADTLPEPASGRLAGGPMPQGPLRDAAPATDLPCAWCMSTRREPGPTAAPCSRCRPPSYWIAPTAAPATEAPVCPSCGLWRRGPQPVPPDVCRCVETPAPEPDRCEMCASVLRYDGTPPVPCVSGHASHGLRCVGCCDCPPAPDVVWRQSPTSPTTWRRNPGELVVRIGPRWFWVVDEATGTAPTLDEAKAAAEKAAGAK